MGWVAFSMFFSLRLLFEVCLGRLTVAALSHFQLTSFARGIRSFADSCFRIIVRARRTSAALLN